MRSLGRKQRSREKAQNLLNAITSGGAFKIATGQLIMLECGIEELRLRNSLKHKYWPDEELQRLADEIERVNANVPQTRICTRGRTIAEVAREIARVIFLDDYSPADIETKLNEFAEGK